MQGWPENKMAATMQVLAFKRRYFTWWWILRVWRQLDLLAGVAPTLQWHQDSSLKWRTWKWWKSSFVIFLFFFSPATSRSRPFLNWMLDAIFYCVIPCTWPWRDATTLVALQSGSISQTYILDSGPRRIALLPAHLHGESSTCNVCCSGSRSLHVRVGLV